MTEWVEVPYVAKGPVPDAVYMLREAGLKYKFRGPSDDDAWVFSQSPSAGDKVEVGSVVTMVTRGGVGPGGDGTEPP